MNHAVTSATLEQSARRLTTLLCATAVVQGVCFAALAPLLPTFRHVMSLSKPQVGWLVGSYGVGMAVGAVAMGAVAWRATVKWWLTLSLIVMALGSVAFAVLDNYESLVFARGMQGAASSVCFAAGLVWLVDVGPNHRRTELIGLLSGARAGGQVLGPVVGGLAVVIGRAGVFVAVASFAALLAGGGRRYDGSARDERTSIAVIRNAHASSAIVGPLWFYAVPTVSISAIVTLTPLELNRSGWGSTGIAGTFVAAAVAGVFARPMVGRWADRRGAEGPIGRLFVLCAPAMLVIPLLVNRWALAVLVVGAICVNGVLFGPTAALLSRTYEIAGIPRLTGFALVSFVSGSAAFIGSGFAGEIAHRSGDRTMFALVSVLCLVTGLMLLRRTPSLSPVGRARQFDAS